MVSPAVVRPRTVGLGRVDHGVRGCHDGRVHRARRWISRKEGAGPEVGSTSSVEPLPPVQGLRDPELAGRLEREGYARLGAFLSEEEVGQANAIFEEARSRLAEDLGDRWLPTILLLDNEVRAFITSELEAIIGPHLDRLFVPGEVNVVRLDYSVKPASPDSELGPHQDFSLVDESVAQSLYLWIPLCDTDERNGTLHVVPGSHRFSNRVRSQHVPAVFDEVLDLVHAAGVRLDCVAGELVVMVSGVIHYSPPNQSGELRLAAHGIVTPSGVPLVLYYADDETPAGQVECYELDIERYVQAIHQGRPKDARSPDRLVDRPPSSMAPHRFQEGLAAIRVGSGPPAEHGAGPR